MAGKGEGEGERGGRSRCGWFPPVGKEGGRARAPCWTRRREGDCGKGHGGAVTRGHSKGRNKGNQPGGTPPPERPRPFLRPDTARNPRHTRTPGALANKPAGERIPPAPPTPGPIGPNHQGETKRGTHHEGPMGEHTRPQGEKARQGRGQGVPGRIHRRAHSPPSPFYPPQGRLTASLPFLL